MTEKTIAIKLGKSIVITKTSRPLQLERAIDEKIAERTFELLATGKAFRIAAEGVREKYEELTSKYVTPIQEPDSSEMNVKYSKHKEELSLLMETKDKYESIIMSA